MLTDGEEGPLREVGWKLPGWEEPGGEREGYTPRACLCLIFVSAAGSQDSFPPLQGRLCMRVCCGWFNASVKTKAGNRGAALSGDSGREGPDPFMGRMANRTGCTVCKARCKIKM